MNLEKQAQYISENFPDAKALESITYGNLIVYISADKIVDFLGFLRDDKNLNHALEFKDGIVVLPEIKIDSLDKDLAGITTQTRRILELYKDKRKPIYLCLNNNANHYTTLAVVPELDEKKSLSKASYRYIDSLFDSEGDLSNFSQKESINSAFSQVFQGGVRALPIEYKRQQCRQSGGHNNECGIHNAFNILMMLQQGPTADMGKMRECLKDIPGNNPSQNGGIDPDDAEFSLRPVYQSLFNIIFKTDTKNNLAKPKSSAATTGFFSDSKKDDTPTIPTPSSSATVLPSPRMMQSNAN